VNSSYDCFVFTCVSDKISLWYVVLQPISDCLLTRFNTAQFLILYLTMTEHSIVDCNIKSAHQKCIESQ